MTKSPLKLVAPDTVNRTVIVPRRKPNSVYRTREHLTGAEVDRLIDAAKANRWGHRDATMRQCANATPFSRLNATEQ
jgi:type 1 fimbriae regulatory protein FimB/type 1 fimbriae regulatory protein FimE